MSRLLAQIDPNLPPLNSYSNDHSPPSTSSSPSSSDMLPSPSKDHPKPDRMKEWIFPRASSQSSSSPLSNADASSSSSTSHARSSSIAKQQSQHRHEATGTKDLRHRSNFSLIHPGTPELSISPTGSPSSSSSKAPLLSHSHTPSRLGGGTTSRGTNGGGAGGKAGNLVRAVTGRKGLNDLVYFMVFGGAFVLFASSLFGVGYEAPTPSNSTKETELAQQNRPKGVILENVEIAKGFRETEGDREEVPADVYQSVGEYSSHDKGEEFVRDSPDDPGLDDEHVHETYHAEPESALFPHPDHPAQLDDSSIHRVHEQNRPRPARLPPHESTGHTHAGHEEEHELLEEEEADDEYSVEEEEADDDEHGQAGEHDHSSEIEGEEEEEEELVDDTISISNSPKHDHSAHVGENEEEEEANELADSEESLTALEELLLDADDYEEAEPMTPEEEEAQHLALQHRRPVAGSDAGGDSLEKLRREREELGRARERWEAKMRAGELDEDEIAANDDDEESWNGSGELRHRRMAKRIRR